MSKFKDDIIDLEQTLTQLRASTKKKSDLINMLMDDWWSDRAKEEKIIKLINILKGGK
jgi:hypothetical protein